MFFTLFLWRSFTVNSDYYACCKNLGRCDHSESIVEKIEQVTCTLFLLDNFLLDLTTRHSLLSFNRNINKKVMRNFICIQHIVKITVVLGQVLEMRLEWSPVLREHLCIVSRYAVPHTQ